MSALKLYDCKVGMRASDGPVVIHEARKLGVTAPEVLVLQTIHGDDLVTELRHSLVKRVFLKKDERARLSLLYGQGAVKEALGAISAPMPKELEEDQVAPALIPINKPVEDVDDELDVVIDNAVEDAANVKPASKPTRGGKQAIRVA